MGRYAHFDDDGKKGELRSTTFREFLSVMTPYFWPEGLPARVRAFSCFAALILSKVCHICAPLMLGDAVSELLSIPPSLPVGALIAYAVSCP